MANITWMIPGVSKDLFDIIIDVGGNISMNLNGELAYLEERIANSLGLSAETVRLNRNGDLYISGRPQFVGRIPEAQELSVLPSNPEAVPSNPSGEVPLRGQTGEAMVIEDGGSVTSFSSADPEEPLRIYSPSESGGYTGVGAGYSGGGPQPWSRDYKKQNQHLFRKRKRH